MVTPTQKPNDNPADKKSLVSLEEYPFDREEKVPFITNDGEHSLPLYSSLENHSNSKMCYLGNGEKYFEKAKELYEKASKKNINPKHFEYLSGVFYRVTIFFYSFKSNLTHQKKSFEDEALWFLPNDQKVLKLRSNLEKEIKDFEEITKQFEEYLKAFLKLKIPFENRQQKKRIKALHKRIKYSKFFSGYSLGERDFEERVKSLETTIKKIRKFFWLLLVPIFFIADALDLIVLIQKLPELIQKYWG